MTNCELGLDRMDQCDLAFLRCPRAGLGATRGRHRIRHVLLPPSQLGTNSSALHPILVSPAGVLSAASSPQPARTRLGPCRLDAEDTGTIVVSELIAVMYELGPPTLALTLALNLIATIIMTLTDVNHP